MSSPKSKITTAQATVIIINYMLAAGVLTLPRTVTEQTKSPDGWISVLLGGGIAIIAGIVIVKLSQQYPKETFYEYSGHIVGKWLGAFISLIFITYFLTLSAFEVRVMSEIVVFFLLEGTPSWAIVMTVLWIGLYSITQGLDPIARLFEMIFPVTVIIFLTVALMSIGIFEVNNLRPVLGDGIMPVLKGVKTTALSFTCSEIMLILVAFMKKPKKAVKAVIIGTGVVTCFYIITVVMVIGAISVDGVVTRTWPALDLMRSFEISGLIFERFESFLLVIWIMQLFATFTITFYAASLGVSQVFKKKPISCMFGLLPVVFILSSMPKNENDVFILGDLVSHLALYIFGALPILLLVISKWRKRGET
ncbi:spore germination protein [Bacillus vallismortis]|uniref:spore germination protein n=1 Tax=Bacillus vallismortis TaxID=72361 RepID=UPI00228216A1|nr:spore germination protein [Bacillus vallismortis]MCY8423056.1 spore germination protein [Bacillus vallismortis]